MAFKALIHEYNDSVAVATDDIAEGEEIVAVDMSDSSKKRSLRSTEGIKLGHKIALKNLSRSAHVIEYGEVIGEATKDISIGDHVHTHNLKSLRWK